MLSGLPQGSLCYTATPITHGIPKGRGIQGLQHGWCFSHRRSDGQVQQQAECWYIIQKAETLNFIDLSIEYQR